MKYPNPLLKKQFSNIKKQTVTFNRQLSEKLTENSQYLSCDSSLDNMSESEKNCFTKDDVNALLTAFADTYFKNGTSASTSKQENSDFDLEYELISMKKKTSSQIFQFHPWSKYLLKHAQNLSNLKNTKTLCCTL